jgi:Tfp pilus assembly protein PilF
LSLRKEKLELAKQLANRLLEISPNNSTYLDTYGWVLYVAGDYANAKTYLEKAAQNTQNPTIIEHYGDVLFKLGQTAQAQELWKKAKTLSGTNLTDKLDRKIAEGKLYE